MGRRLLGVAPMLVAVLVVGAAVLALSACGGGGEEQKTATGGSAPTDGQIVFRRYFNPDQTKGALFTMNPDGSHVSQITHPPTAGATRTRRGLPMGRGWPSIARGSTST
jgi:hypothetical protein